MEIPLKILSPLKGQGGNSIASSNDSKKAKLKQLFGRTLSSCTLGKKVMRIWLQLWGYSRGL
jgi:hypothetical protein